MAVYSVLADFFITVVGPEILPPSPVKNPRKLKGKQYTNYPIAEEVLPQAKTHPLKSVFYYLKGRGPFKKRKKFAEM